MVNALWFFPAGVLATALFPDLPAKSWLLAGVPIAAGLLYFRFSRPFGWILCGVIYGCGAAYWQLHHQLPDSLDKTDIRVSGVVCSLPDVSDKRTRFEFCVGAVDSPGVDIPPLRRLLVSWYHGQQVRPGERWSLLIRLRAPRGFSNPGGFDYESWLFAQGISATGYVRKDNENHLLNPPETLSINRIRAALLKKIQEMPFSQSVQGFLAALVLGEKGLIPGAVFDRLVSTGTVHLMVVSGLHVGMVAGLCFLVGMGVGRVLAGLGLTIPAKITASLMALLGAGVYGLLAGGDLPVQRALVMTAAVLAATVSRRQVRADRVFGWALTGVALLDPLAAIRPGFWLSFGAVAGLIIWFVPRPERARLRQAVEAQFVVFAALAPILIYFQGTASIAAIPLNLMVIPWISLSVVPLSLGGALAANIPVVNDWLWTLAARQLEWFDTLLIAVEKVGRGLFHPPATFLRSGDEAMLLVGAVVALIWLLPRGIGLKPISFILLLALLLSTPHRTYPLSVTVLDVGQGLAVVVRVDDYTLVYDTGSRFSDNFDAGKAVLVPYLSSLGIHHIDMLVVSHGDADHAGGVEGLLSKVTAGQILAGQPAVLSGIDAVPCMRGVAWQRGDVRFRTLWPDGVDGNYVGERRDNNQSCVLLIEKGDISILLPGDIEAAVERELIVAGYLDAHSPVSLLVAPHHGSKTSSSAAFIAATTPQHVIFSSGFNHHFGHPHDDVVVRYKSAESNLWWTSRSGAITMSWDEGSGAPHIEQNRAGFQPYWRQSVVPDEWAEP